MKGFGKYASLFAAVLAVAGLVLLGTPQLAAQATPNNTGGGGSSNLNNNNAPCDFSDQFYMDNGIDPTQLVLRFGDNNGTTRLTGPPASGNQKNYVADSTCATKDPTRRNFRILATTGGNSDDNNSPFTCFDLGPSASPNCANQSALEPETFEFINIMAFLTNQNNFESTVGADGNVYKRTVGFINGGLQGVQQNPGESILLTPGTDSSGFATGINPRGFAATDIVSNFEAYAALKQRQPNGVFAIAPCSDFMNAQSGNTTPPNCFPVNSVQTVFTPNLTQDWRFATNRNAMDGSDNNDPVGANTGGVINAPFGYFCDDLLGMWIITYFWLTEDPLNPVPGSNCAQVYANISAKNGKNLDGGPIILTAHELNDDLEGNLLPDGVTPHPCGAEGKEDPAGSVGGAMWLICPAIPDPRNFAITSDAFLDQVKNPNGTPQNLALTANFLSLQVFGKFANELNSSQQKQILAGVP